MEIIIKSYVNVDMTYDFVLHITLRIDKKINNIGKFFA